MELVTQLQSIIINISLFTGVLVTLRSFVGFFGNSSYLIIDRAFSGVFVYSLYIQIGFIIYIFLNASFNYEASLKAVEYAALTLFATILTTGGQIIASSTNDDSVKFRFRGIFYGLATGLLIYACIITLCLGF